MKHETEELRTLLENAAKACGFLYVGENAKRPVDGLMMVNWTVWQPHLPGLDSQVLAAELEVDTDWLVESVMASTIGSSKLELFENHPSKTHAQAMAVLRAAAAIGSSM